MMEKKKKLFPGVPAEPSWILLEPGDSLSGAVIAGLQCVKDYGKRYYHSK